MKSNLSKSLQAFSIIEIMVVILIIGILAVITFLNYSDVSKNATISAIKSDLVNASDQLEVYYNANSNYPTVIDCSPTPAANTICLKTTSGNSITYTPNNAAAPPSYLMTITNGSNSYQKTQDTLPYKVGSTMPTCTLTNFTPLATQISVAFVTSNSTSSTLEWGKSVSYGFSAANPTSVYSVAGLSGATTYYFKMTVNGAAGINTCFGSSTTL